MRKVVLFFCLFALAGAAPAAASITRASHPVFRLVVKRGSKLAHLVRVHDSGTPSTGSSTTTSTLQATISGVGAGSLTLTIGTQQVTVPLPAGLTLPSSLVGAQVTLDLSLAGNQGGFGDDQGDDNGGDGGLNLGHAAGLSDDGFTDDQGDDDGGSSVGQGASPGSLSIVGTHSTRH